METKSFAEQIIAMEKSALEEWNKGNPSGYLDIYSQDITYFDPFQEQRMDGFENIKQFYEGLRGKSWVDKYEFINPIVNFTETMAVLTYNLISYSGDVAYKWNCTEVYRLESDKQWRIIHNHWSFVKPQLE